MSSTKEAQERQPTTICSPCVSQHTQQEEPGRTSSSSHHPENHAKLLWSAAVCWGQQWRHSEVSVPCQLYPVGRSSLTRVSPHEAPGRQIHVKFLWRESFICWRASKGQACLPKIFPCEAAAAANARTPGWQQQLQQYHCPSCPILPGECSTLTGWPATWGAQMGEWQPRAAAVELLLSLWQAMVCFCVCVLQLSYLFLFPFPCTGTFAGSKAANLKIMFPQWPLPHWWCGPRVINQISDLHIAISQEMLSTLHAEWRNDGLSS